MGALERIFHELRVFLPHFSDRSLRLSEWLLALIVHQRDCLVEEVFPDLFKFFQVEIQSEDDFGVLPCTDQNKLPADQMNKARRLQV